MTVRTGRGEGRALSFAAALVLPLVATGCATPYTQLEWGTQRGATHVSASTTVNTADVITPTPRPTYTRTAAVKPRCLCDGDTPVPSARPRPAWYQQANARPVRPEPASYPPSTAETGTFAWPVHGRVLSEFGSTSSGERNDGINIAAVNGEPIRAASDGTVSYSGNELKSYGNLVLLRHDNGYVTAYAHADHFVVSKGEHVSKGQIIGYVGSTGDVSGPQLHFELRKGARGEQPVNPRTLLSRTQVASR